MEVRLRLGLGLGLWLVLGPEVRLRMYLGLGLSPRYNIITVVGRLTLVSGISLRRIGIPLCGRGKGWCLMNILRRGCRSVGGLGRGCSS